MTDLFRKFVPIKVHNDQSFIGLYLNIINDKKSLVKKRTIKHSDHEFDYEDSVVEVDNKDISLLERYMYEMIMTAPLVVVKAYKDSAEHFGKHERRKNLINAVCNIYKVDNGLYYLDQDYGSVLQFFDHELEFMGYEDYSRSISRYSVGDVLIAKYTNISPEIKKGDRVVVEKINSNPDRDFYETLIIRKIETGKEELPTMVLPKHFKREKKSNYEGIQQGKK